ncbi:hypothetical protein [Arachidicoccus sp.]|uniref:hypothetical protein n=1 Tax=Arachidicoccus sp. TaxID=1872624 RepID=UPI003D1A1AF5
MPFDSYPFNEQEKKLLAAIQEAANKLSVAQAKNALKYAINQLEHFSIVSFIDIPNEWGFGFELKS